jgi:hypothetical protein
MSWLRRFFQRREDNAEAADSTAPESPSAPEAQSEWPSLAPEEGSAKPVEGERVEGRQPYKADDPNP